MSAKTQYTPNFIWLNPRVYFLEGLRYYRFWCLSFLHMHLINRMQNSVCKSPAWSSNKLNHCCVQIQNAKIGSILGLFSKLWTGCIFQSGENVYTYSFSICIPPFPENPVGELQRKFTQQAKPFWMSHPAPKIAGFYVCVQSFSKNSMSNLQPILLYNHLNTLHT